jgi:hypothetical protein
VDRTDTPTGFVTSGRHDNVTFVVGQQPFSMPYVLFGRADVQPKETQRLSQLERAMRVAIDQLLGGDS